MWIYCVFYQEILLKVTQYTFEEQLIFSIDAAQCDRDEPSKVQQNILLWSHLKRRSETLMNKFKKV